MANIYEVELPDGNILEVDGDQPPTRQQVEGYIARTQGQAAPTQDPAAQPAPAPQQMPQRDFVDTGEIRPGPGFFGEMAGRARVAAQPIVERNRDQAADFARYGVPIAAGLATGGMGALPAAGVMLGSGLLGEWGGQMIEGDGVDVGEIGAAGVMAAVPVSKLGVVKPFEPLLKRGAQVALRGLSQLGITAGAEQVAEAIRDPGVYKVPTTPKEVWDALTSPAALIGGGLGSTGALAEGLGKSGAAAKLARDARKGDTGMLLTELEPRYASLEARRLIRKDPTATENFLNQYADFSAEANQIVSGADTSTTLASEIAPFVAQRNQLAREATEAEARAAAAQRELFAAQNSRVSNVEAIKAKAQDAAQEAALKRAAFEFEAKNMLGLGTASPTLGALSPAAATKGLQDAMTTTIANAKSTIGELRANVGIGINEPITTKELILRRIDELASNPDNRLNGVEAKNDAKAYIEKMFPTPAVEPPPVILGARGTPMASPPIKGTPVVLSAERYIDLREEIAEGLETNGMIRDRAEKLASEMYAAVRSSTDDFIAATAKDKLPAWTNYNKTVANWFNARDNAFIRDFISPRTGEIRAGKAAEFVNSLVAGKEGVQTLNSLNNLARSIEGFGTPAAASTANAFREQVSQYIAKGVLESAIVNRGVDLANDAARFDPKKLYKTINTMASNGFETSRLGLGKPQDLNALARMAQNRMLTRAEVQQFFADIGSIGGNAAAARVQYRNELRNFLLSDPKVRRASANVQRLMGLAKTAKLDADGARAALNQAQQDPLVRIFDNGNFGFKGDLTAPDIGAAIQNLDSVPRPQLRSFMTALTQKNPALASRLQARKVADVLQGYKDAVPGVTPTTNMANVRKFLYDQSDEFKRQREGLMEILGPVGYKNFTTSIEKMAPRFRAEAAVRKELGAADTALKDTLSGAFAAGGLASGNLQSGAIGAQGTVNFMRGFIDRGRYSTYHLLFINPSTARFFASTGYNLDKFLNQNGAHRVLLQIAERQDDEAAQVQQQAEPQ